VEQRAEAGGIPRARVGPCLFSSFNARSSNVLVRISQLVCYCDKAFGVLFLNAVSAFKSARVNIAVVFARSALQFRFPTLAVVQNFLIHYQAAGTNRG
jgi:hypothetical protein